MKPFAILISAALIAMSVSYVTVKVVSPGNISYQSSETAYDRVLRTGTIRCGYFVWAPNIMKDPNTNKISGINHDIMQKIGEKLDLKVEWTTITDVAEIVVGLNAGKYDVMCASLWPNAGILKNITLTEPEFYTPVYGVVRKGDDRFDGNLQKANNPSVHVSAIDSDITADLAHEFLPKATEAFLPQDGSGSDVLLQITTRKADIAFVDRGLINNFILHNPDSLQIVANVPPMRIFGERLAVARHEFELKQMIDLSLEQLINDGTIKKLVARYTNSFDTEIIAPNLAYTLQKGQ